MSGNYSDYNIPQSHQRSSTFDYGHGQAAADQWNSGSNQPYQGTNQAGFSGADPRVQPVYISGENTGQGGGFQQQPRFPQNSGPLLGNAPAQAGHQSPQRPPRPPQPTQSSWQTQSGWQKGGILDEFRQPNPAQSFNQSTEYPGGSAASANYKAGGNNGGYYQGYKQPQTAMDTAYQSGQMTGEIQSQAWPPKINLQGRRRSKNKPADAPGKLPVATNPLQMLNVLRLKVTWQITGDSGDYQATIQHNHLSFTGIGASKKAAQHAAARQLLQALGKPCPDDMETNVSASGAAISELNILIMKEKLDLKLEFVYDSDGPPFTCHLTLGYRSFDGKGPTKKAAKACCAADLLQAIKDETFDLTPYKPPAPEVMEQTEAPAEETPDTPTDNSPLSVLNSMFPGLPWAFTAITATGDQNASINLSGKTYTATAKSKRLAKLEIAIQALSDVETGVLVPTSKALKAHTPKKRKASELEAAAETDGEKSDEIEPKKPKMPENLICQVTSLFPRGIEWSYNRVGPSHQPMFSATATLIGCDRQFEGQGENKKKARYNICAEIVAAVESGQFKPPSSASRPRSRPSYEQRKNDPVAMCVSRFGTLNWETVPVGEEGSSDPDNPIVTLQVTVSDRTFVGRGTDEQQAIANGCAQINAAFVGGELETPIVSDCDNTPWSVVARAFSSARWEYKSVGPVHEPAFYAFTTIQGVFFEAMSGSKKAARHECCRKVLDALNAGIIQALPNRQSKKLAGWFRFNRLFKNPEVEVNLSPTATEDQYPQYIASVKLFGTVYTATGASEEEAKENLAITCNNMQASNEIQVPILWQFAEKFIKEIDVLEVNNKFTASYSFMDKTYTAPGCATGEEAAAAVAAQVLDVFSKMAIEEEPFTEKPSPSMQTPLAILNAHAPQKYQFVVVQSGTKSTPFIISTEVDGKEYRGSGRNKMAAKQACASVVLSEVYGHKFDVGQTINEDNLAKLEKGDIGAIDPQSLSTTVQTLIETQYSTVAQRIGAKYAPRKVLAGCVVTIGDSVENAELLALACGNKCVEGGMISHFGDVVNDMHAEVLVRRVLKRYLCEQIQNLTNGLPSIIEHTNTNGPKYKVKDGVRFHLYISSPPCGDSRLFTVSSNAGDGNTGNKDDNPNRASRGQLRVKIEAGQGTVLFNEPERSAEQNWEAIMSGDRYINMSCSDKVARWSILGFQGSLLSKLLGPVYFSSVIVGSMFHKEHIHRALYGRLKDILSNHDLTDGYRHQCPEILGTIVPELRNAQKPPSHAVIWQASGDRSEVLDTRKGKSIENFGTSMSFVSKRELFDLYRLVNQNAEVDLCYDTEKRSAKAYQELKAKLYTAISARGLGRWVSKVPEQDLFVAKVTPKTEPVEDVVSYSVAGNQAV